MIDLLLKSKEIRSIGSVNEIVDENSGFLVAQFRNYTQTEIDWAKERFGLDFSIMSHYEDIEISSHFLENRNQISFHFSVPYYNKEKQLVEEPLFIVLSDSRLFLFECPGFDTFVNETYAYKISNIQQAADANNILKLWLEFISDYYADITENLAKRIKALAAKILIEKKFASDDMDIVTQCSFDNLLIKESVNETVRIYNALKKSKFGKEVDVRDVVDAELNDLAVVSDYIQFNFERIGDLKDSINNKIDVEQNHIFKILTVITLCLSLPTIIAGMYGMNFDVMPELKWTFGYPFAILFMVLSATIPYIYFKRKKWLK